MIKFIYDNRIVQLFALILGLIFLRLALFQFNPIEDFYVEQRGIFRYMMVEINYFPWLSFWVATAVLVFHSLILGQIVSEYNIVDRPGYSILFFYGLLSSLFGSSLLLNYVIVGQFFMLIGFWYLYRYLKGQYKRVDLFVAALFMGVSALSVPEFFWALVFLIVIVLMFKTTQAGEVFTIVFGILIPYYLISSIGYLASTELNFKSIIQLWNLKLTQVEIGAFDIPSLDWIVIANLMLIGIFGAFKVFGNYYRYNVDARRSRLAMGFIAIFIVLIYLLKYEHYNVFFVFMSMPIAVYTANLFQIERPSVLSRLLFYMYVIGLISYGFI